MLAQIMAAAIFVVMFLLIITEIFERHIITLVSALLTIILVFGAGMDSWDAVWRTLNLRSIISKGFWIASEGAETVAHGINWETIIFIVGMMIMVEGMAAVGFFRWLCMRIAKAVHYKIIPLFVTFMVLSAILAMFIDSITVILFLAAVTIELSQLLKFNPVPMILAEIFCANLGGSSTMCGDPPNIIIGTSLGYSFADFITNTGVIAMVSLVLIVLYFYLVFRKELQEQAMVVEDESIFPSPEDAIVSKRGFIVSLIIFLCTIVLLVTHAQTGLTVALIGTVVGVVTLLTSWKNALHIIKQIDYKTLLFFIGLFVVVGGLEETGVLELVAEFIGDISKGNLYLMVALIVWASAIFSAFVDNIPFAATMIPVIQSIAATQGINLDTLVWSLTMGADVGGSATPIGASANVVGVATAAKNGHIIKWGKYCKAMVPATFIVILVSMIIIMIRYI